MADIRCLLLSGETVKATYKGEPCEIINAVPDFDSGKGLLCTVNFRSQPRPLFINEYDSDLLVQE
jgi:hypothetical protein